MSGLDFLKPQPVDPDREPVRKSRPNSNPNGQRIKAGGMTLVHCRPDCDAEFRSGSHDSVIAKQLDAAGWQALETKVDGEKVTTYRCPGHKIMERAPMSGRELDPRRKRESMSEKKLAGRSSHDGGDQ